MFPAKRPSRDPRSSAWRRHHVYPETVQRRVKEVVRAAGIAKPASCHTDPHARHAPGRECRPEPAGSLIG
jgi:hypothetical protein